METRSIDIVKKQIIYYYEKNNKQAPNDQDFLSDCAKIGAFLMDTEEIHYYLVKLNSLLVDELQEESQKYTKGMIKKFRSILENELAKVGFKPKLLQVISELNQTEFSEILSQGWHFKDSTFRGDYHGEFTHPLQWVFIAWQVTERKLSLKNDLVDIYKKLGEKESLTYDINIIDNEYLEDSSEEEDRKTIWDIIFDAKPNEYPETGFRCPEYLFEYIENNEEKNIALLKFITTYRKSDQYSFSYKTKKLSLWGEGLQDKANYFNHRNDQNAKYHKSGISEFILEPKL